MASLREINHRISSVKNTQQITKAMNLVAASKLQKSRTRLESIKPFYNETQNAIKNIVGNNDNSDHRYLVNREGKRTAMIVITGDRGLCGSYNTNVSKTALHALENKDEQMILIGNKSRDYFKRRNKNIVKVLNGISESPEITDAQEIANFVMDLYESNEIDEVLIASTTFNSTISHEPKITKLLPVTIDSNNNEEKSASKVMSYEPSEEVLLDYIIPKYVVFSILGALIESSACEQGARMTSMDTATENASEMIDKLTLTYNRARQGAITQEITEIVSGANAIE